MTTQTTPEWDKFILKMFCFFISFGFMIGGWIAIGAYIMAWAFAPVTFDEAIKWRRKCQTRNQ